MSKVVKTGPHWHGFPSINRLFIFGDSYSEVGYNLERGARSKDARPNDDDPLGISFPGFTYNEPGMPNWVGHLITKYSPAPRYDPESEEQEEGYHDSPLLVYDYAIGGGTVRSVEDQVQKQFLQEAGKQAENPIRWTGDDSLFVTWVGINDVAQASMDIFSDAEVPVDNLFDLQEELYTAGARNFLFIDVPPISRSPAVYEANASNADYDEWNSVLARYIEAFTVKHQDITALLFSSAETFNRLLDDPVVYGFEIEDRRKADGGIWFDHLHPTSKVHDIIAKDVAEFLAGVPKHLNDNPQS